jgi:hypothetical protein
LCSSREVSKQFQVQTFFKLLLQAGEWPQQQLEDFRRTSGFNYKDAEVAESLLVANSATSATFLFRSFFCHVVS